MARKKSNGNGYGNGNDSVELILEKNFITKLDTNLYGKKVKIKCKNQNQKEFIKLIDEKEIIICNGPSGCGKSHLSIAKAIEYIQTPDNGYNKIYIITPTVEITRSGVGFLPGTFADKVSVYMNSVYKLFDKIISKETCDKLLKNQTIEILGLGYIRGENLDNSILIVEESQNISIKEMLTILTRIGEKCKLIISGDLFQIDAFKCTEDSGLYHSMEKLKDIDGIGIFEFSEDDIVRNSIITEILKKYYL